MRLMPVGTTAMLIEVADLETVFRLHAVLRETRPPSVLDLVPAERTVLVRFDPAVAHSGDIARWVRGAWERPGRDRTPAPDPGPALDLPVHYDGADLAEVGRLTGLGADGVVAAHTGQPWRVAFTGFAPGFGYLVGGDRRLLAVQRRESPRTRVPAGAVALAAGYSGVYPRSSPGGWHLLGHTDVPVWDVERDPPALLVPGLTVRFLVA